MPEMLEEHRESWGSRGAFVFAAIGSAVGLGNLWGFPYRLYESGGAAFLIPYIIGIFCIGIPVMILEFSMGHFTQRAAPDAFARIHGRSEIVGWWGTILAFVIVTYYPVILAYCFSFLWFSLKSVVTGAALPWAGHGMEGVQNAKNFFEQTYLVGGKSVGPFQLNILIPLVVAWLSMYLCIFRGVKLIGKVAWLTVPLPWLMLAVLTLRGLTLDGSIKGLVYYLEPDFSQLWQPGTWRAAFGQVFFSLSLGFGTMLTYASFLHRKSDLNNNAAIISISDFATSFIAGLAIFSTLGGMAYVTQQAGAGIPIERIVDEGPGLAFVAFPYALAQLPGAPWWSLLFFFILITLGVNSAFSITESVLASVVDKTGWPRWLVLVALHIVGFGLGFFYITKNGLGWLGTMNGFIAGTWGIAFLGLLECLVIGWAYRIENLRNHANERSDFAIAKWWRYAIRIVIPLVLGTLFFWSLFDDLNNPNGFIRTPEGDWIWRNCVGLIIIALAPIIAMVLSLMKNPTRVEPEEYAPEEAVQRPVYIAPKTGATFAFLLAVLSAGSLIFLIFAKDSIGNWYHYLLIGAAVVGLAALAVSNYLLDKNDRGERTPSWFARWAGMVATFDISAVIAISLISLTRWAAAVAESLEPNQELSLWQKLAQQITGKGKSLRPDTLSTTSYIILFVVILMIVGGFGWSFYRAIMAASNSANQAADGDYAKSAPNADFCSKSSRDSI
jgi:NSS family neurotransmitter:Na+ symporter